MYGIHLICVYKIATSVSFFYFWYWIVLNLTTIFKRFVLPKSSTALATNVDEFWFLAELYSNWQTKMLFALRAILATHKNCIWSNQMHTMRYLHRTEEFQGSHNALDFLVDSSYRIDVCSFFSLSPLDTLSADMVYC